MRQLSVFLLCSWMGILGLSAQPEDLTQVWPAKWIAASEGQYKEYGVQRFRKVFELDSLPESLVVHSSGDNRYHLYVNGERITTGPLRGDLDHWYYESTDLRPWLRVGKNVIAAEVLNYGSRPPDAQMSVQTAFLLAADDRRFRHLNTPKGWKAIQETAYSPNWVDGTQVRGYYGGGAREQVDGRLYLWGWETVDFDDSNWQEARVVENAFAKTCIWASRWKLTPRHLPQERLTPQQFTSIRLAEGIPLPTQFLDQGTPIQIPPHTQARIIFDQGATTTAFPRLTINGGAGTTCQIKYVEAPVFGDIKSRKKGHRGEIEGKNFYGYSDQFIADGGDDRTYRPLHWRGFRYLELSIETQEEALEIEQFDSEFATFPFENRASLEMTGLGPLGDTLQQMLAIGERTLRLNAHETFMDCPYYEESQFPGDTRVQALVSYVLFGDSALGKNAINQFAWSINSEGFLSARYPTNSRYYIPNYSLYWIGMLHDYHLFFGNRAFIQQHLPVMRSVLAYFERLQRSDGSIRRPDYHNFVDWAFKRGEAPFGENDYAALVDLHMLMALQWAAELEAYAGEPYFQQRYQQHAQRLKAVIQHTYWQADMGLFSDTPEGDRLSAHTNHLAILTEVIQGDSAQSVIGKVLNYEGEMTRPTIYWLFYQFEALKKAGLAQQYPEHLGVWKEMIRAGVTTWPETGLESRSECHAWGASPNYHLYTLWAGIAPSAPAFEAVHIAPALQDGQALKATFPHPKGDILVDLSAQGNRLKGQILLPPGLSGELHWQQHLLPLKQTRHEIHLD
ncbi:MAG: family 78 glycoside hydrolase catalytic domain [Bacteroidota bacterium]